jgi:hypothetical protein
MQLRYFIIALVLVMVPALSQAEFYKYRDANGVLRFTDDITEVPADQRAQLKEYKSVATPKPSVDTTEKEDAPEKTGLDAMAQQLETEKAALEEEYQALAEEDRRIKASVADPNNPPDPEAYNEQLKALQRKIEAYDARRRAFQEKAAAFDAHVKKQQRNAQINKND